MALTITSADWDGAHVEFAIDGYLVVVVGVVV